MYGADWCGDCRRAKAYFADNDVAYDYIDVEANPDEIERILERNGGVKKIPLIVFADDSHLVEPDNAELGAKLAELQAKLAQSPVGSATAPAPRVVVENVDRSRFELLSGPGEDVELLSFADYRVDGNSLIVPHVETMMQHRGNGFADELMVGMVVELRRTGRTIVPLCSFAAGHLRDRPEDHDVLAR